MVKEMKDLWQFWGVLLSLIMRCFSTVPRRLHASSVARVTTPGQLFIPGTCLHWQRVGRGHFTIGGFWGKHDSVTTENKTVWSKREQRESVHMQRSPRQISLTWTRSSWTIYTVFTHSCLYGNVFHVFVGFYVLIFCIFCCFYKYNTSNLVINSYRIFQMRLYATS